MMTNKFLKKWIITQDKNKIYFEIQLWRTRLMSTAHSFKLRISCFRSEWNFSSQKELWAAQFCHPPNGAAPALDTFPSAKVAHSKNSLRETSCAQLVTRAAKQRGPQFFILGAAPTCAWWYVGELDPWTLTSGALWKPRRSVCVGPWRNTQTTLFCMLMPGGAAWNRDIALAAASMHPGVNNAQAEAAAPQDCCVNACGQSQDLSPHRTK